MAKNKKSLSERLESMAEDIQIGGDVNFRGLGCAVVLAEKTGSLTPEQRKAIQSLLSRANRLLGDLSGFWDRYPELESLIDIGEVACSEGLAHANSKGD